MKRLIAILFQRCPVCLEGAMFERVLTPRERCPICGHEYMREQGFFQGAMFVSYGLGVGSFATFMLVSWFLLGQRIGLIGSMVVAVIAHVGSVPMLFRYSRVLWAHLNVATRRQRAK